VSCASAGNCAVTGYYTDSAGRQGFVVDQNNGDPWGNAIAIPALSVLNTGGEAAGTSVSCASAGNCAVTGYYNVGSVLGFGGSGVVPARPAGDQGFVVNFTSVIPPTDPAVVLKFTG
jgi:hypothetical protein